MKKLLFMLMVLILLFSACSRPEEPISEEPESEPSESLSSEEENPLPGGINPDDYDEVEDYGFMYVLSKTEGTREYKKVDGNGSGLSYLDEEPAELIWIVSKDGEFLNEDPFQKYGALSNHPDTKWWVYGIRGGILYPFYIDENTGEVTEEEPWSRNPQEFFGYTVYKYYWNNHTPYYGVLAPDGSDFADPIYVNAYVPNRNRIVLINGNSQLMGQMAATIYDENKNVINESFNWIFYNVGSCPEGYVGLAYCGDPNEPGTIIRFDKNGNPMETGYYFVDGSGNIIKGPFKNFTINDDYADNTITSGEDIIKIIYFNGEEEEFPAKEILVKD